MKKLIKASLKNLIQSSVNLMGKTATGRFIYSQIINNAMSHTQKINHQGTDLIFSIPNALSKFRAETFSTKEPETLEWIDGMSKGSVVWDIGANVGIYSCYAAKRRGCKVFAFEPSVFNLELLARNVFLNGLVKQVTIVPLPLSDSLSISRFNMMETEWGGALSSFGQEYGYDGKAFCNQFEFSTIGLSMNEANTLLKIPIPDYIKMDVDGIEHLILKGGGRVLQKVRGILVEINDEFQQQAENADRYLSGAGLILKEKRQWKEVENTPFGSTFNQIWIRDH